MHRIQAGEIKAGEPLPAERALMAEFSASRGAVREAIQLLAAQGLLRTQPRHRPVVRAPGYDSAVSALQSIVSHLLAAPNGVKHLFETRTFVEIGLARYAAVHAQKDDIYHLKEALEANRATIEDNARFFETDKRFHEGLFRIPGNPAFLSVHHAYTTWLEPQWTRMPRNPERNALNYAAHKDIFDAILSRDADLSEAAMQAHLNSAWDQVRNTFGDNDERT